MFRVEVGGGVDSDTLSAVESRCSEAGGLGLSGSWFVINGAGAVEEALLVFCSYIDINTLVYQR